jgi:hypothetical protein
LPGGQVLLCRLVHGGRKRTVQCRQLLYFGHRYHSSMHALFFRQVLLCGFIYCRRKWALLGGQVLPCRLVHGGGKWTVQCWQLLYFRHRNHVSMHALFIWNV